MGLVASRARICTVVGEEVQVEYIRRVGIDSCCSPLANFPNSPSRRRSASTAASRWRTPDFPEEVAYQIVMSMARNAPKMKELHALWKIWSPELMLHGLSEENVHPGAKKAFVELA